MGKAISLIPEPNPQRISTIEEDREEIELTDAIRAELDSRLERHRRGEGKYYTLKQAKVEWSKKRK